METQPGQPIEVIASQPVTASGGITSSVVPVRLRSVASQPIDAYVLVMHLRDAQGKLQGVQVKTNVVGLSPEDRQRFQPGDTWTDEIPIPQDKMQVPVTVVLDHVSFVNGERWGADKQRESRKIEGMRAGWRQAMAYLQRVRTSKGDAQALAAIRPNR